LNYRLYIIALCGLLSFVSGEQKFTVGGQIRHRFELQNKAFNKESNRTDFSFLRTRINLNFYPVNNVSAFIQIQDSRLMGQESNTLTDGSADQLDLHQAFSKINIHENLSLKLGRFEVNYGTQRLIGAVGWHNVARSFDGLILNYKIKNTDWDFFNFKEVENLTESEKGDKNVSGVHGSFNLIPKTKLELLLVGDDRRRTFAVYAAGSLKGLGYEFESSLQNGNNGSGKDYQGLLWAANFNYDISGHRISGGIDYVSGDDSLTSAIESFNTLYATNHKYYGFMDYFINIPSSTSEQGLYDMHLKLSLSPIKGLKTMLAWHSFQTADKSKEFGQEIDITLKYKLNSAVLFQSGYSVFNNAQLESIKDRAGTWAYFMTIVNF